MSLLLVQESETITLKFWGTILSLLLAIYSIFITINVFVGLVFFGLILLWLVYQTDILDGHWAEDSIKAAW